MRGEKGALCCTFSGTILPLQALEFNTPVSMNSGTFERGLGFL